MAALTCPDCEVPGDGNCSTCRGKGRVLGDEVFGDTTVFEGESPCPACGGSGECQTCGGMGEIELGGEGG
jgi:DnaJ-class molecular chaperone